MKKEKIVLFVFLLIGVLSLIFMYNKKVNLNKNKLVNKSYAIYVKENNSSSYINSKNIPKGSYLLNKEKSFCENNGEISSYDNVSGVVGFSFIGSDRCTLYFDEDSIAPTISDDLKVENNILTVTLNDNVMLKSYGLSSSSDIEPEEWLNIPTTPYTLSTSITSDTPYLWVKDAAGNVKVSDEISFMSSAVLLILNNNGGKDAIEAKDTPDFTIAATENEGMYAIEDDLGTSYYFRGAVDNNWLKFGKYTSDAYACMDATSLSSTKPSSGSCSQTGILGKDIYWRIVRINGDGSIRLIYSGITEPTESTKVVLTTYNNYIGINPFNNTASNTEYGGFMYTLGEQHGSQNNSNIKLYIENWYNNYTNLNQLNDAIAEQIFCNDRTTRTTWMSNPTYSYYFDAYQRLYVSASPSLLCPNSEDKFTVSTTNGNGKLNIPVGLLTADELVLAGSDFKNAISNMYLNANAGFWLGTSYYWNSTNSLIEVAVYINNATQSVYASNTWYAIRPVISISKDVNLSGDGTWNNPYVVES